jgi:succinate dehydrogenase flavin-adding protein (antitoxin of CptAB toxin-antitoxin module)
MTANEISTYLVTEYGECRHDAHAMANAINQTLQDMDCEYDFVMGANDWDLFHLLVENTPIPSLHTHSYGFHTANGRNIIERIQDYYYEFQ